MTKEEKQLLLRDLCARLPYGIMFQSYHSECGIEGKGTFDFKIGDDATLSKLKHLCESGNNKPYLRPMPSMTEEERNEWMEITHAQEWLIIGNLDKATDWLNAHHFDFRGLIPLGLALEAKEGMYKTE